ncbi:hypothetical protein LC593_20725 [Nostoc sp. CHAB 5844]|nr:hypothetical protein [Nostoc sp. CHAB 5844]
MTVGKAAQRTAHRNGVAPHERLPRMGSHATCYNFGNQSNAVARLEATGVVRVSG